MRPARLALLTLPLLVPIACFQSSDDSMAAPDGSAPFADSGVDTSIPDALAPFADGGTPDTSIADVVVDVAPLPVTVRVTNPTGPEEGVVVVFDTAAGVVSGMGTTDAAGEVTQMVAAGSEATVVLGTAADANLVTVMAIEPGDVLSIFDSGNVSINASIDDVTNAATAPDGTATFLVQAGSCETSYFSAVPLGVPQPFSLYSECYGPAGVPLFLTALDANSMQLAYAWRTAPLSSFDAGTLELTAGGTWSTATSTQSIAATNVAADTVGGELIFSELSGGVPLLQYADLPPVTDAGVPSIPFTVHTGYPDAIQTEIDVPGSASLSELVVVKRESAPTGNATTTIDLSTLLPSFIAPNLDTTNPSQPTVTWTTSSPLTGAAGLFAQFSWFTDVDSSYYVGTWTIIAPSTATSAPTPALPASLAAYAPNATSSFNSTPSLIAVGGSAVPSYAALRALQGSFSIPTILSGGPFAPPLPANGTLVLSVTAPGGG
jgi:hypothetical protein